MGIRDKRFSCGEVMTSVVERIRTLNPTLKAIVVDRNTQTLVEATAADRTRSQCLSTSSTLPAP